MGSRASIAGAASATTGSREMRASSDDADEDEGSGAANVETATKTPN